eukprot:2786386-Amphidinium_carterae.2
MNHDRVPAQSADAFWADIKSLAMCTGGCGLLYMNAAPLHLEKPCAYETDTHHSTPFHRQESSNLVMLSMVGSIHPHFEPGTVLAGERLSEEEIMRLPKALPTHRRILCYEMPGKANPKIPKIIKLYKKYGKL